MTRMIRSLSLAFVLGFTCGGAEWASAEEAQAPAPVVTRCQGGAREEAPKKHEVYASSAGCLRTFRQLGTYDDAVSALNAARGFRREHKLVWITTGEVAWSGLCLHPHMREQLKVTSCTVYSRSCSRSGWQREATSDKYDDAERYAQQIQPEVRVVDVVYHFADKTQK